jgi:hypothetical protein
LIGWGELDHSCPGNKRFQRPKQVPRKILRAITHLQGIGLNPVWFGQAGPLTPTE